MRVPPTSESRRRDRRGKTPHIQGNSVRCLICGEELHKLAGHLKPIHGLTTREYRDRFPGAATVSENYSQIKKDNARDQGSRPYWTKALIRRALRQWASERGAAPTTTEWRRPRSARPMQEHLTGKPRKRPTVTTVLRAYGTWAAALDDADLGAWVNRRRRCPRGHLLEGENVVIHGGHRYCRECRRRRGRESARRRRARMTV